MFKRGTTETRRARCSDCGKVWPVESLDFIDSLSERIYAGEEVPAGQCPSCQACCHLVDEAGRHSITVSGEAAAELIRVREWMQRFEAECQAAEYTDTGEAWEILEAAAAAIGKAVQHA